MQNEINFGAKELFEINIKLNQPLEIEGKKYEVNETILLFDKAQLATINQSKNDTQSTGGYHNNVLVNWEIDKELSFALKNGVLSPISWAILSNSKINNDKKKSIPMVETLDVIADNDYSFVDLLFVPNATEKMAIQENPNLEPMPMGRRPELALKPLPPSKNKFFFVYDYETGERIKHFEVFGNRLYFQKDYKKVCIDYTFWHEGKSKTLEVGNRLTNGFLRMTAKMNIKDENTGKINTAIIDLPKIKINSSLSIRLGSGASEITVSDFYFTAYPDEKIRREDQTTSKITFLDVNLDKDYL